MVFNVTEGKADNPEEPAEPNEVRVALSWLFSSGGTLNFEDSQWTADFDGENGLEFRDEENETKTYIPPGASGDLTSGSSGGGGAVDSVFGRDGAVEAQSGDYSLSQVGDMDIPWYGAGDISDRPAASDVPAEARFEDTTNSIVYRNDPSNGWVVIGGTGSESNPLPEQHVGSLSTERPVTTILDGDGAQSIIESASAGTWFIVEPGAVFDISNPPLEPPASSAIDAGVPGSNTDHATFRKAGDGDLLSVPNQFRARGITFDGQRSSYTGDGLVDAAWNLSSLVFEECRIKNMAGHARVHDAPTHCRYENLHISDCDGFGFRNLSSNYDGFRRAVVRNLRIANCAGGIKMEASDRDNSYNVRLTNLNGPGIHVDSGTNHCSQIRIEGSIRGNDGVAIYQESGRINGWDLSARLESNAENESTVASTPVGAHIHIDGGDDTSAVNILGGRFGGIGADADAMISDQSSQQLRLTISGGSSANHPIEGQVIAANINGDQFSGATDQYFNGVAGYAIHTHYPGEGMLENLDSGSKWYFGWWGSSPDDPGTDGSLYLDAGSNTSDGEPSWRVWTGGSTGSWQDL